jgi:hypothetical protein
MAEANTTPRLNWVQENAKADWQARDSQGEVVFDDKLWIMGGWFSSYKSCPRDVWSSPDGKSWDLVQTEAPWKHSDLPMTVVHNDRMWFMGGWYNGRLEGHEPGNEVWSSTDGVDWDLATDDAGWTPRLAGGIVNFQDRIWITGGIENYFFGNETSPRNDVWHSSNGKDWTCATDNAGWSPRAYHQSVVFDNKLWVIGGGNYVPEHHALNDVWCSEDGTTWTQVTDEAPWGSRLWFSSVVYRDRMWVIGGWSQAQDNFGDVWYSSDGANWTQLETEVIWKSRHEHSAYVFKDKIWIAGGHARPLDAEVWSLHVPEGTL